MTIIMNKSRMFDFTTHNTNPIGGCPTGDGYDDEGHKHCSNMCDYCWSKGLKNRFRYAKYEGPWRLYPGEMKKYGPDDFPWPCDMIDIGDPTIPEDIIWKLLEWIAKQPCRVLLLTKNPSFYRLYADHIPANAVLGATIECDEPDVLRKVSGAPSPYIRLDEMQWLKIHKPENLRLICVEPIMKFTPLFAGRIAQVDPWIVAVGYDSGSKRLDEPSLQYTKRLIDSLDKTTTATIYIKELRPSWWEKATYTPEEQMKIVDYLENTAPRG